MSGLSFVSVGLVALGFAKSVIGLYSGLALLAVGVGLCSPTLSSMVSLFAHDSRQGSVLGTFRAIGSLARAVGPLLASFIFWWFGSLQLYLFGAAITAFSVWLCSRVPTPTKD